MNNIRAVCASEKAGLFDHCRARNLWCVNQVKHPAVILDRSFAIENEGGVSPLLNCNTADGELFAEQHHQDNVILKRSNDAEQ